jgi:hypothetical protein
VRYIGRMRLAFLGLFVILACGPSSPGGDDDGGPTSGDDDDDGATSADDDDDDDDGDESGAPSSTGAASCEMYEPVADIGPAVDITVRHDGTTPVFFDPYGCGGSLTFTITAGGGEPVPYLLDSECTPNTCDGFVAASDCFVGCNDCGVPSAGRIDAGGMGDSLWPGRINTELELLAECVPEGDCPDTCQRPEQAPPGTYEIAFTAYRTCTGTCECDGPSSGICSLWSYDEALSDPVTFRATVDYPTQTAVEIVITD